MKDYSELLELIASELATACKHPEIGSFQAEFNTKGILTIDWTFADYRMSVCTANLIEDTSWAALLGGNIKIPTEKALEDALTAIRRIISDVEVI